ncbi:phosphoadenosine phosphosulfate reductase domain-containing protein [Priestia aryabhattai]|uniref:phosphoadenosine phosphosulfate reductase domain-containing protein n=1 Tax=Priestia aryabhattai TaxID=412384 RepID=UPI0015F68412|nr:phosphoadenosine phosphosulfate reductase family protein [Priestia aryabhattai]
MTEILELTYDEKLKIAIEDLTTMYLNEEDDRDWALAWSGGKDSTTVMGMVDKMLQSLPPEKRKRTIHAVMSDTIVENPVLEEYMRDQLNKLDKYVKEKDLPITVELVHRQEKHSYFYLILGRGYFLPQNNGQGRWCTDRLKLQPQNNKLKDINPSYILVGTRLSESEKRKQSIEKWTAKNDLSYKIGDHASLSNSKTFMPIIDFDIEDVWRYLQQERLGWSSTHQVRKLYKDATGECGFSNPKATQKAAEGCGARFGCWTCPVILNDRSTEQMSITHDWMNPLVRWRELQMLVFGEYVPPKPKDQKRKERSAILKVCREINKEIKKVTKSGHKRNGNRMVDKTTGELRNDQGTFTVEAREFLFNELIKTQNDVNKIRIDQGLEPITLIHNKEIEMIKEQWEVDRKTTPWLVSNVNGKTIDDLKVLINNYYKVINSEFTV